MLKVVAFGAFGILAACDGQFEELQQTNQALVTFDATTGTGFVGKGDVQLAFGWNNAQLQSNAAGLSFAYAATETVEYVCEWTTGPEHNRKTHRVSRDRTQSVSASVAFEARRQNQITGFTLNGFGGTPVVSGDEVPSLGDPCPGNPGTGAVVTSVEEIESTGGLVVSFGGTSVPL
jgi:hypothetical protein